ncbi:hypothetical protein RRF57_008376 [Xylaria bambusicola]|uniref:U6 snRNA phosphodiesterase 1 n=1 Tax=Xylaria bambusicola TaxID=326684 RepID=A0AAN7Z896_9PEZI
MPQTESADQEMGLVDYSDSDESVEISSSPRAKRQKTTSNNGAFLNAAKDALPPFHPPSTIYTRPRAGDDPALHQGRKRVNPHKVGYWPSHLYIEWHPTSEERATLTTLLSTLQSNLNLTSPSSPSSNHTSITSFLTSDLGAPQPLHISLSRPIVLSTAQKDAFLSSLESRIRTSGIAPFELSLLGLQWHRTEESSRSSSNPQLTSLLSHTNGIVTAFDQPPLYAWAKPPNKDSSSSSDNKNQEDALDDAFHISIAWSFALPSADLRRITEEAFTSAYDSTNTDAGVSAIGCTKTLGDAVRTMRVRVEGIKAKIGNVVTHIPLPNARSRRDKVGSRGLFGI